MPGVGCQGCTPLVGGPVKFTSGPLTITGTGFSITEVMRIVVPPTDDILKLKATLNLQAITAGQLANGVIVFAPATAANLLGSVGGGGVTNVPDAAVNSSGEGVEVTALPPDGGSWPSGDYVLGVNRQGANGLQVVATTLQPAWAWWER